MGIRRVVRTWNPGNVLVVLGVIALGFSFWMPHATAGRVARVEDRAERMTRELCAAARAMPDLDFESPDASQRILERLGNDRLEPEEPPAVLANLAVVFKSKHYLFMVTRKPREDENDEDQDVPRASPNATLSWRWCYRFAVEGRPVLPAFEAYAWPISRFSPGQSVFYHPSDDEPAFCRNMDRRYTGLAVVRTKERTYGPPRPGAARKQLLFRNKPGTLRWYRGFDNERWLVPRSDVE